ncbi:MULTISPECIES: hypothetical protein [unclassified Bartonella]|uniref:hypothetical protein n=2 Tax=unclassified Bartonella TaxID=2645622 RepID=UPI0035D004B3
MLDLMFRENAWGRFLKGEYFMQEGLLNRCCVFEAFAFVGHISVLFLVLGWGETIRYGLLMVEAHKNTDFDSLSEALSDVWSFFQKIFFEARILQIVLSMMKGMKRGGMKRGGVKNLSTSRKNSVGEIWGKVFRRCLKYKKELNSKKGTIIARLKLKSMVEIKQSKFEIVQWDVNSSASCLSLNASYGLARE